jgi:hypothetical protein
MHPQGRTGPSLSSGEDNHLVLSVAKSGYSVGYFPELVMTHLIPETRLRADYLGQLNYGIAKSWVQLLALHEMCPWNAVQPWTVPLRKLRAFFRYRAWAGAPEYIRWRGACGHFAGRSLINR